MQEDTEDDAGPVDLAEFVAALNSATLVEPAVAVGKLYTAIEFAIEAQQQEQQGIQIGEGQEEEDGVNVVTMDSAKAAEAAEEAGEEAEPADPYDLLRSTLWRELIEPANEIEAQLVELQSSMPEEQQASIAPHVEESGRLCKWFLAMAGAAEAREHAAALVESAKAELSGLKDYLLELAIRKKRDLVRILCQR